MTPEEQVFHWLIDWGGIIIGAIATVIASYHFKGKEAMRQQLETNTREIEVLKKGQANDRQLLTQKMDSVENELRDMKESFRDDVGEIKDSIIALQTSMTHLSENQGELRGTLSAFLNK